MFTLNRLTVRCGVSLLPTFSLYSLTQRYLNFPELKHFLRRNRLCPRFEFTECSFFNLHERNMLIKLENRITQFLSETKKQETNRPIDEILPDIFCSLSQFLSSSYCCKVKLDDEKVAKKITLILSTEPCNKIHFIPLIYVIMIK